MFDVLPLATANKDWHEQGACGQGGVDPDLFYPVGTPGSPGYDKQVSEAQGYCATCPVINRCLLWAVESVQEHGVWGGTEEHERLAMIRIARSAGTLAVNRYPTNREVSGIITRLLDREQADLRRMAEQDAATRARRRVQRGLQKQR